MSKKSIINRENMNAKLLFAIVFMTLAFSSIALADGYYCADANNSFFNTTVTVSNVAIPINTSAANCPFGCSNTTGQCNADPYDMSSSMFYLLFPLISFVLLYFSNLLKEEDWPIHMLLIGSALFFIIVPLGLLANTLPSVITGLYWASIVVTLIVMFYYIIKIITKAHQMVK